MELLRTFLQKELKVDNIKIIENFDNFNKYLLEWNEKVNLISRKSQSIESQVLNSIFYLIKIIIPNNSYIVDIGTGGGFPGIPLKILRDDLKILLVDSIVKKTNAVKDMTEKLHLKNVEIKTGRAEEISIQQKYKEKFDIVTAKSVAPLDKLFLWSKSFLKRKGKMIFIKGGDISEELNLLKKKNRNINVEVIGFEFDSNYGIEDKKIVIINMKFK